MDRREKKWAAVELLLAAAGMLAIGILLQDAEWKKSASGSVWVVGVLWVGVVVGLFLLLNLYHTMDRSKKLRQISERLDLVLHGEDIYQISHFKEGDLAILEDEITKMTVMLREQSEHLQEDKRYLADSMADLSHQLRTPLTSIRLITELLSAPDLNRTRKEELLREMSGLLTQTEWQVNTMLKLSRLDADMVVFGKKQISVGMLLEKAAEPLSIPLDINGIRLRLPRGEELFWNLDLAWTAEAIENILKNCMEHTPAGGCITVEQTANPLYLELKISDTGAGIAREDLPYIFQRFYKGKGDQSKGFGIGLALARSIIAGQNGTIQAENGPDGGASFLIRFYKGVV